MQILLRVILKNLKNNEIELNSSADIAANIFLALLRSDAHLKCLTHPNYAISDSEISTWVEYAVDLFMKNINYKPS